MEEKRFLYINANHAANLNEMRLNNKGCDVTIRVNKKEFCAHKVVLAANLKYFDTMLSNDSFKESKQDVVSMEGLEGVDLEPFVSYAYTGEILLTDSNILDLLELANYLGEDGIKDACIEFLEKYLKKEDACWAYKFAYAINCLSLKDVAKRIILSSFENCSQTTPYLDFDYEHLIDILSDVWVQPIELQFKFFKGIMRWIMKDVQKRKICMNDLLNSIDMTKLSSDELIDYLCGNLVNSNDEYNIIRDVMVFYHNNKTRSMKCQSVMIVGFNRKIVTFQFCNLSKKKWSSALDEIPNLYENNISTGAAVLNNEFYYTSYNQEHYLNVFNPTSKRSSPLKSSSNIPSWSAMCACSEFLYLCGGRNKDGYISNQILMYDPLTNSFETLPPMRTARTQAAAIFYQGCLLVLGGLGIANHLNSVEKYDPNTKQWTDFPSMCENRDSHLVAVLDGKLYACGGYEKNKNTVEVFEPSKNSWQLIANMNKTRWQFLLVEHEGKLLAIGGDLEKTVEVYDPNKDKWQIDQGLSSGLQIRYPQGNLISSSYIVDANQHFRSSET